MLIRARQLLTFSSDIGIDADDVERVGLIEDGGVHVRDGVVERVAPWADFEGATADVTAGVVMPGWIDCHTHALFGGTRHGDFARRNTGETYASILAAGGGIMSTVGATRATSDEELGRTLEARLRFFHDGGCAAVEVKSGYGLSFEEELRHLRIIRAVAERVPVEVVSTCLAAHALPAEMRADRAGYVSMVCERLLPEVAAEGLASHVDVFCDRGAFTVEESRAVLETARGLGLGLRVHAEELAATGATRLAADLGARSADHLEHVTDADIDALVRADVAAVILPTVTVFLDLPDRAPARAMAARGVRLAVSTDFNPGSAHGADLQLACSLACSLHKLGPGEALRAVTRVPADILGLYPRYGVITPGASGRLLSYDVADWRAIPWFLGDSPELGRRWIDATVRS